MKPVIEPVEFVAPRLLSVADIIVMGRFSKAYLYSLVKKQQFPPPAVRLGSRYSRWATKDVELWFASPELWLSRASSEAHTAPANSNCASPR